MVEHLNGGAIGNYSVADFGWGKGLVFIVVPLKASV